MIYGIVNQLYNDMITGVGSSSSYADNKVENVYIDVPKTIVGNTFVSVNYGTKVSNGYVIGQKFSFTYTYAVDIVIGVKHSSKLDALNLLDILEKRVLKVLNESSITSLEEEISPIKEKVLTIKLVGANYEDLYEGTDLMYGIRLNLEIETQLDG